MRRNAILSLVAEVAARIVKIGARINIGIAEIGRKMENVEKNPALCYHTVKKVADAADPPEIKPRAWTEISIAERGQIVENVGKHRAT